MPKVSIIIPAYNSENDLPMCFEALLNQSFNQDDYEIIVVDNNSSDNTLEVIRSYPVKMAVEKQQSSYAARNKGIKLAQGELLIFTDADCIPCKDWLKAYIECYRKTKAKLIGGTIDIIIEEPNNSYMIYDKLNHMNQKLLVTTKKFAATANLMVHKDVFDEVGWFDSHLISGGDSEFGHRATKKFEIVFCPKAKIKHHARGSLNSIIKKKIRIGYGFAQRNQKTQLEPLPFIDMVRGLLPAIGYLNPNFGRFKIITEHQLPKKSKIRLNLFIIDIFGKFAQFIGELRGRNDKDR